MKEDVPVIDRTGGVHPRNKGPTPPSTSELPETPTLIPLPSSIRPPCSTPLPVIETVPAVSDAEVTPIP